MSGVTEKLLEDEITAHLVGAGGYRVCKVGTAAEWRPDFDAQLGLDTVELFRFVEETQVEQLDRLVKAHGGNEELARRKFVQRLAQQIDERGTVDVLRHGVRDQNVEIRLSYRRPAFGVAPELVQHYEANRLTVTRQLPYDPDSSKTLDLCLFLNGLPVATAELKNQLTGQNVEHAIGQYRTDRDPKDVTLGQRAIVHFAVDPDVVSMTTRLEGKETRFLPFNLGHELGAGNPPNPHGHKTSYLWERVWTRDAWLDILHRFIHVERPAKGSASARRAGERVIFPRYHQWDAVLKLEADAAVERRRPLVPGPALGRLGKVEHDRLDGPPPFDPPHLRGPEGLRQGRRDHGPRRPRPPAPGHDLPVRARPRGRREDRRELRSAGRGACRRAGADHHHHSAEVPVRARQGRRSARAQLRRHRRRGPLLPDRRSRQGPPSRPRSKRGTGAERRRGRGLGAYRRGCQSSRGGAGQSIGAARRPPVEPLLLRLHGDPEGPHPGDVRHLQPGERRPRAVPPLLDAPGDRGGVHHGRPRQLHDLQDVLEDREGDRGGPRVRGPQGAARHCALRQPAPPSARAEGARSSSSTFGSTRRTK